MYAVDGRDRVTELDDIPQCSPGAPCPLIVQDEGMTIVAYYVYAPEPEEPSLNWEPVALVRFHHVRASMFGPPNDEAFHGHPLATRGLRPCSAAEVEGSSWIRILARMNSVHPLHRPERYAKLRHFVLSFHDSTFECVAERYDFVDASGAPDQLAGPMMTMLRERHVGRR